MTVSNSQTSIALLKLIPDLDAEYAIEVIGGSEAMYESILKRIVRLMPSNIEQMDLLLGMDNSLHDFEVRVHGVKSSLRQAGHMKLARNAEDLEWAAQEGDRPYCEENYASFREGVMRFCDEVNAAVSQCTADSGDGQAEDVSLCDIRDFIDVLQNVKQAAEAYDSMSAAEYLMPLAKHRFGEGTDKLIANALEALDIFKPRKALEYLEELLS